MLLQVVDNSSEALYVPCVNEVDRKRSVGLFT